MKTGSASGLKGLQSDAQSPAEGQALLAYLRLALRDLILLNIFISDLDKVRGRTECVSSESLQMTQNRGGADTQEGHATTQMGWGKRQRVQQRATKVINVPEHLTPTRNQRVREL